MKIIFSTDFINRLSQNDQILNLSKYFITSSTGNIINKTQLTSTNGDKRELYSIWDIDKKILSISIDVHKDDINKLLETVEDNNNYYAYVSVMYSIIGEEDKVAFIIVGDVKENSEDNTKLEIDKLNFSITKNLLNISLKNISIAATLNTVFTENIKILESSIEIGNNIYLVGEDDLVTITKKSFLKKLYRDKCSESNNNIYLQNYIKSNTGERVYRDMILRTYNTFLPRLVGDVIIITSEGDKVVKRTTTTTQIPEVGSTTTTTEIPHTTTTTTTTSTGYPNIDEDSNSNNNTSTTTSTSVPDSGVSPMLFSLTRRSSDNTSTTKDPNSTTTTTTNFYNDNQKPEEDTIIEYNSFGLSCNGGNIEIVGIVGYKDYIIRNNTIIESSSGYQNITDLPNLIVKTSQLYDKNETAYGNINLTCSGRTIKYGKNYFPEITLGNTITISLPTSILTDSNNINKIELDSCYKEFKLKQSNDFDAPWEITLPSKNNIDIGYEYESVNKGLALYPAPVIIFDNNLRDDIQPSYSLKLTTTDEVVIKAIGDGLLKIKYEYADNYSPTEINTDNYAKKIFDEFFTAEIIEDTNFSNTYLINITCKKYTDFSPYGKWIPFLQNSEGNYEQLLIRCKISLKLESGLFLNNTDTYESPFYVVRKPNNYKNFELFDNLTNLSSDKEPINSISLSQNKDIDKKYESSDLLTVASYKNSIPDPEDKYNSWILYNPNKYPNLCCIKSIPNLIEDIKDFPETGEFFEKGNYYNEDNIIYLCNKNKTKEENDTSISLILDGTLKVVENKFGNLTLDTNYYKYEYSDKLKFISIGTENNLNNIIFNYLDAKIFGTDDIQNIIKTFDITNWKNTILMPKTEISIIKKIELSVNFNNIIKSDDDYVEVVENLQYDQNQDKNNKLSMNIGRVGEHYLNIISNRDLKVVFIPNENCFIHKDTELSGNTLIDGDNKVHTINLLIKNSDLSGEYSESNVGVVKIYDSTLNNELLSINVNSLLYTESFLKSNFIKTNDSYRLRLGNPNIDKIFLTGYKYDKISGEENSNYITTVTNDIINFDFIGPITPVITGTSYNFGDEENPDNCLILGTTINNEKGWVWDNYLDENGIGNGYHTYHPVNNITFLKTDPIILGSCKELLLDTGLKSIAAVDCSSKINLDSFNKYYKYPVSAIGEVGVHILGTSYDYDLTKDNNSNLINYKLYKRGLQPKLYNYNNEELINTNVYFVKDIEESTSLFINSLYPLSLPNTDSPTTLTLSTSTINLDEINCTIINTDSNFNWQNYKENLNSTYEIKITGKKKENYIVDDLEKYPVGSVILKHFLPTEKLLNVNDYNDIDSDLKIQIRDYIEKSTESVINLYWVGKNWAEITGDLSDISFLGETRKFSINKPQLYTAWTEEVSSKLEEVIVTEKINGFLDPESTKNYSTVDFNVEIGSITSMENLLNEYNTINLADNIKLEDFKTKYNNISDNTLTIKAIISTPDLDSYEVVKELQQPKLKSGILYTSEKNKQLLFLGNSINNIEKITVPYNTTEVNFQAVGLEIDNLLNNNNYIGESVYIELINSDNSIDISQENQNIKIILSENQTQEDISIDLKISYNNNEFYYTIIQKACIPMISIKITDNEELNSDIKIESGKKEFDNNNILLGFHSSGSFLNNYITITSNYGGIYTNTEQINIKTVDENNNEIDLGLEYYIDSIYFNENDTVSKKVILKLSPNYIREEIKGFLVLFDGFGRNWYISFIQGYITTSLTFSKDYSQDFDLLKKDSGEIVGEIGTKEDPILYPSGSVKIDPYFYVKVLQREAIYTIKDQSIKLNFGNEVIISSNYGNISKINRSILENKYTTVTYHADPWISLVDGGLLRTFVENSYDTDLYYYPGEADYYPRLIHKYDVADGYGDDELLININVKIAISRYKINPIIPETTENLISPILNLDTTPFKFSFWIKKESNKKSLPIQIYEIKVDEEGKEIYLELESGKYINFNGVTGEEKKLLVKLPDGYTLQNDIEINSSDNWLNYSKNSSNMLTIVCDGNTSGFSRYGVITLFSKDSTWSGIKTLDIKQSIPETTLDLPYTKKVILNYGKTDIRIDQYFSIEDFELKEISCTEDITWIEVGKNIEEEENTEIINEDNKVIDFEKDKKGYRWLFRVLEQNDGNEVRLAALRLSLKYTKKTGEDVNWEETVFIEQDYYKVIQENSTTTTTTSTTETPPEEESPIIPV